MTKSLADLIYLSRTGRSFAERSAAFTKTEPPKMFIALSIQLKIGKAERLGLVSSSVRKSMSSSERANTIVFILHCSGIILFQTYSLKRSSTYIIFKDYKIIMTSPITDILHISACTISGKKQTSERTQKQTNNQQNNTDLPKQTCHLAIHSPLKSPNIYLLVHVLFIGLHLALFSFLFLFGFACLSLPHPLLGLRQLGMLICQICQIQLPFLKNRLILFLLRLKRHIFLLEFLQQHILFSRILVISILEQTCTLLQNLPLLVQLPIYSLQLFISLILFLEFQQLALRCVKLLKWHAFLFLSSHFSKIVIQLLQLCRKLIYLFLQNFLTRLLLADSFVVDVILYATQFLSQDLTISADLLQVPLENVLLLFLNLLLLFDFSSPVVLNNSPATLDLLLLNQKLYFSAKSSLHLLQISELTLQFPLLTLQLFLIYLFLLKLLNASLNNRNISLLIIYFQQYPFVLLKQIINYLLSHQNNLPFTQLFSPSRLLQLMTFTYNKTFSLFTITLISHTHYNILIVTTDAVFNHRNNMLYLTFATQAICITPSHNPSLSLQIQFNSYSLTEVATPSPSNTQSYHSLIGIKFIKNQPFLLLVNQMTNITSIGFNQIHEIKSITVMPIAPQQHQQHLLKQFNQQIQNLQMIFSQGHHYYSDSYDLSLPYLLNKITKNDSSREYYNQFIWNLNLSQIDGHSNELQIQLFSKWCTKIIQGHIEQYSCPLSSTNIIRYFIISRRSCRKAGTRFYARGIDDDGNVANFVETEQIAFVGNFVFTNLQIRGSVPVFFSQMGVNGISCTMSIERSASMTRKSFLKHFQTLSKVYSRILIVNLLSDKKQQESKLIHAYEQLVRSQCDKMPNLKYQFYDFHEQCKGNRFQNCQCLIEKLTGVIDSIGFNCYHSTQNIFYRKQKGIFRTNCLDCLDRTNYVQSRIALKTLKFFLRKYADEQTKYLIAQRQLLQLPVNQTYPILYGFNNLWADNGDAISLLYTSIGSTHTDITRTGERTIIGTVNHKLKSLLRFYAQFTDHNKHDTICSLVTPSSPKKKNNNIHDFHTTLFFSFVISQDKSAALEAIKKQTIKYRPALIVCFVFDKTYQSWLDKIRLKFISQQESLKNWQIKINTLIQQIGFQSIAVLKDRKSCIEVYCAQDLIDRIFQVKKQSLSSEISQGQALLIKIRFQQSSFVFVGINCPIFSDFMTVLDEIHEKGFQISKLGQFRSTSFLQLDYRVILGNVGSNILIDSRDLDIIKSQLKQNQQKGDKVLFAQIMNQVLDKDQLSMEQNKYCNTFLRQYSEGPLQFIPTSNRMIFWNKEGAVLRVRDYAQINTQGIAAVLDYEISRKLNPNSNSHQTSQM